MRDDNICFKLANGFVSTYKGIVTVCLIGTTLATLGNLNQMANESDSHTYFTDKHLSGIGWARFLMTQVFYAPFLSGGVLMAFIMILGVMGLYGDLFHECYTRCKHRNEELPN